MDAVLPWPWEVVCLRSTGTQFQLGRAMPQPSLSLRVLNPSARNAWSEIRVSSGSKQSIAQRYKKGKAFLCLRAARLSSPRLKSGTSRREVVNANKRIYVIGDVHGQFEKLAQLLRDTKLVGNTLSWTGGNATLWFMGDFFDRGPGGIAVVDLVMRLQEEAAAAGGRVESLLGNHEVVLLAARRFGTRETTGPGGNFVADWVYNGGFDADLAGLTLQHMDWIINLPAMALVGDWLFVHADTTVYTNYGTSLAEVNEAFKTLLQGSDASAWDELLGEFSRRREFGDEHGDGAEKVIQFLRIFGGRRLLHGHTPISYLIGQPPEHITAPFVYAGGRCINVDGGMYLGGPGFVYELP